MMEDWNPVNAAPYGTPVRVKVGHMTFVARLVQSLAMDDDDEACDQWLAEYEGEHPPCWTAGACWATNEDGVPSLPVEGWHDNPPELEARAKA